MISGRLPLNPSVASRRFSDRTVANIPHNTPSAATMGNRPAAGSGGQSGYHRFGEPGSASL